MMKIIKFTFMPLEKADVVRIFKEFAKGVIATIEQIKAEENIEYAQALIDNAQ